jgi:RNA polymerase sigma factor (TIGR02999 family)
MSEVTRILERVQHGEAQAAEALLPLVYDELRKLAALKMAQEAPGQTLQATALVHEAWLRLAGSTRQEWRGREHFFSAAAEAMRRILVENARRKLRLRHGGGLQRVDFAAFDLPIAVGILASSDQIKGDYKDCVFLGELSFPGPFSVSLLRQ